MTDNNKVISAVEKANIVTAVELIANAKLTAREKDILATNAQAYLKGLINGYQAAGLAEGSR